MKQNIVRTILIVVIVGCVATAQIGKRRLGDIGLQTGQLDLAGATSGLLSIKPNAAAGTWTLTLPNSGGSANGLLSTDGSGTATWTNAPTVTGITTSANCTTAACGAATAGAAVIAASATTVTISTTAITANSQVLVVEDSSLGTRLGVTCNTQALTVLGAPRVTARTASTSFQVSIDVGPTTNPMCFNWFIVN